MVSNKVSGRRAREEGLAYASPFVFG